MSASLPHAHIQPHDLLPGSEPWVAHGGTKNKLPQGRSKTRSGASEVNAGGDFLVWEAPAIKVTI